MVYHMILAPFITYNDVSYYTSEVILVLLQMKYRRGYYQWLVQEANGYWCLAFEEIERDLHR